MQNASNSKILVKTFLLLCCLSCAKVGDPLPPLVRTPDPVSYKIVQQGRDRIEIQLQGPFGDIREIEIYRECGAKISDFQGSLLTRVRIEEIEFAPGDAVLTIADPEPSFEEPCRYQVAVKNSQGRRSPPSLTRATMAVEAPDVPGNLRATVEEERIVVRWDPPDTPKQPVAYLVNSTHTVFDSEFIDDDFVFGEPVTYSVQSVARAEDPTVLSSKSPMLTVTPRDDFAPSPPANVTAVSLGSRVQLLWDAGSESDLAGYFVYRGSRTDEMDKLSTLVRINRYTDETPLSGAVSYYAVTAVDEFGNESIHSEYVTVNANP